MENLSQGSLFEILHMKQIELTPYRVYKICKGIALGMAYLHGRNIIHCDLKSSNVLFDDHHKVKISDFGLSQFIKNKRSKRFQNIGTPQWMAP